MLLLLLGVCCVHMHGGKSLVISPAPAQGWSGILWCLYCCIPLFSAPHLCTSSHCMKAPPSSVLCRSSNTAFLMQLFECR